MIRNRGFWIPGDRMVASEIFVRTLTLGQDQNIVSHHFRHKVRRIKVNFYRRFTGTVDLPPLSEHTFGAN